MRFERPGFGLEFSYPEVTPSGQTVERDDEPFREHARVHLSSPDRRELYFEVVRFDDVRPEDEYATHRPFLVERLGATIEPLTETSLLGHRAWAYAFSWHEEERAMERAVLLLESGAGSYRVIYDPRSELNGEVLATLAIRT